MTNRTPRAFIAKIMHVSKARCVPRSPGKRSMTSNIA
jgi:hypothetical protein